MPADIDSHAPVIARHSININAPLDAVWTTHINVGDWHEWQTDMSDIVPDAPQLHAGGWFTWSTAGYTIRSAVQRVDPDAHETFWGGPANGIDGLHRWHFIDDGDGGTRVETQESWSGPPVEHDVAGMQAALDQSLQTWLHLLKDRAESGGLS